MKITHILYSILLLSLLGLTASAQDTYKIVKVSGNVESAALGRLIKSGDQIQSSDKLKFEKKENYIVVIHPKTGRKIIKGVPDNSTHEFYKLLQSFVKPEERSTATRTVSTQYIEKLHNSLTFDTLLILSPGKILIDTMKLSLKKPHAIRSTYWVKNKPMTQIISGKGFFLMQQENLFGNNAPQPLPRVMLEYTENEASDPMFEPGTVLASFVPLYIDETRLEEEVKVIREMFGERSRESYEEIKKYITSEYAPVNEDNLKEWLKTRHLIKH